MSDLKPLIKGLKYRDAVSKKVRRDGKDIMQHVPRERPLTEDDVLSHRDYGTHVSIVTKDGRRYRIDKKAPAARKDKDIEDNLHPREKILLESGMTATKKGYSYKSIFLHKEKLFVMSGEEFEAFLNTLAKKQADDDQNNE